jgi:uncharacterized repeat protein (TIGR01451 family)
MINSMSDTATNIAGWGKFMRQAYPGTIAMARVQNTTSWSAQNASSEMFELTPQFYSPAPAVGQKWYQLATSGYYGHYLPVGTSVKWTQLKSNGWIRPDIAQPGTSRTSPAYKVTFTPRLYINATEFIDHSQCVFFYVRFCGDGIKDSDRGEQCDDGNMNSGDGCSNICQPETTVNPVCNNLTVSPTSVINGGNITYTCTGTNVTSYSITARDANNNIVGSSTSAAGGLILPANPLGTYTISCFVNGQITTPSSCQKTVTNTTNPTPQIDIDKRDANNADLDGSIGNDTQTVTSGTAAVFKIRVTNNGTEDLRNIVLSDAVAPSCAGNVTLPSNFPNTWSNWSHGGNGNHTDDILQVGEWFEYTCNRANTTAPYTNTAKVNATGVTSGIPVDDTDPTPVLVPNTNPTPQIDIDKRDANNADLDGSIGNDTQTVTSGTAAVFKIRVTNNGTEDLRNIVLSDAVAPSCAGNVTLPSNFPNTWSNWSHGGNGNHTDDILQVGEWFEYTCNRANTTAPYTNTAKVNATGVTSGIPVDDTDPTPVLVPNTNPTCDNLTVSTTGTTVDYSCTGTNAASYRITQNGTQISTNRTGSVNVGYGTFTFTCYVNDSITTSACQKTITTTPDTPRPQIRVIKDDNDNRDDRQFLQNGASAQFTIVVRNPWTEALKNVSLSDPYAPECSRNSSQTLAMIVDVGNRDSYLDPGESFSYICYRPNVDQYTFPNNENRICVEGRGNNSNISVDDCDITRIEFGSGEMCQYLQVSQNGNQVNAVCGPNGSYRLFVLNGPNVVKNYRSNNGQFNFSVGDGNFKLVCVRDGETSWYSQTVRRI